jgi:hypothetical protein
MKLILSNVFQIRQVRALAEIAGKILDCMQVAFDRTLRVITALEYLTDHRFCVEHALFDQAGVNKVSLGVIK